MRLKQKISKQVFDAQDQELAYLALPAQSVCPPPIIRRQEQSMTPRKSKTTRGGRERRSPFWIGKDE